MFVQATALAAQKAISEARSFKSLDHMVFRENEPVPSSWTLITMFSVEGSEEPGWAAIFAGTLNVNMFARTFAVS